MFVVSSEKWYMLMVCNLETFKQSEWGKKKENPGWFTLNVNVTVCYYESAKTALEPAMKT